MAVLSAIQATPSLMTNARALPWSCIGFPRFFICSAFFFLAFRYEWTLERVHTSPEGQKTHFIEKEMGCRDKVIGRVRCSHAFEDGRVGKMLARACQTYVHHNIRTTD
jgi:hypothetical protein